MRIRLTSVAVVSILITVFLQMAGGDRAHAQQSLEARPMDFVLVHNHRCMPACIQWISAEGRITPDSPKSLKRLLKNLKGRKPPVVFQSVGGDVDAALSIGRMIRSAGLETAVGRTQLQNCPMMQPRCPGGTVRAAAVSSTIGVHQITNGLLNTTLGNPGHRNLDVISTNPSPDLDDYLSSYLDEMGVNHEAVFAMMGLATPQGIYHVQNAEAVTSGILTKTLSYNEEPGNVFSGADD